MSGKRYSDSSQRAWFRGDRFFQHEGKWYFNTREGTMEGPFDDRLQAVQKADSYVKAMHSGLLGVTSEGEAEWSLMPKS